jgi:hypothetical protein
MGPFCPASTTCGPDEGSRDCEQKGGFNQLIFMLNVSKRFNTLIVKINFLRANLAQYTSLATRKYKAEVTAPPEFMP